MQINIRSTKFKKLFQISQNIEKTEKNLKNDKIPKISPDSSRISIFSINFFLNDLHKILQKTVGLDFLALNFFKINLREKNFFILILRLSFCIHKSWNKKELSKKDRLMCKNIYMSLKQTFFADLNSIFVVNLDRRIS